MDNILEYSEFINEIVGGDRRCTNITLRSFGICVDEPVMDLPQLKSHLIEKFGNDSILTYNQFPLHVYGTGNYSEEYDILDNRPVKTSFIAPLNDSNIYDNLNGIFAGTTTNQFVKTIVDVDGYGHYVLSVRGHVLGVHYMEGKGLFMVDTERKFMSRRQVDKFYVITDHDRTISSAISNFSFEEGDSGKIKHISV